MNTQSIQFLYGYNSWANRRILDTAAALMPKQLTGSSIASFDSIHNTLVHTMGAQWMWLSRWQGVSPKAMLNPADFADIVAIKDHWAKLEQQTGLFVQALDETALEAEIHYTTTEGTAKSRPLWQLMLHQVNHATQHRSEIAAVMTHMGHSPGWLDIVMYVETNGS
jgi:uncharacterized damage-inducible protein DinB